MLLSDAQDIRLGDRGAEKVYCGDSLVWQPQPPAPIRPVPSDYENLLYFSFTDGGNRAINTGFRPNNQLVSPVRFETRIRFPQWVATGANTATILGGAYSDPVAGKQYYIYDLSVIPTTGTPRAGLTSNITGQLKGSTTTTIKQAATTLYESQLGKWLNVESEWSLSKATVTLNGQKWQTYTQTPYKPYINRDVWIGANGDPSLAPALAKRWLVADMAYAKLYDDAGTLVRDFVPAKRTIDGVEGFWDFVTEQFFTSAM